MTDDLIEFTQRFLDLVRKAQIAAVTAPYEEAQAAISAVRDKTTGPLALHGVENTFQLHRFEEAIPPPDEQVEMLEQHAKRHVLGVGTHVMPDGSRRFAVYVSEDTSFGGTPPPKEIAARLWIAKTDDDWKVREYQPHDWEPKRVDGIPTRWEWNSYFGESPHPPGEPDELVNLLPQPPEMPPETPPKDAEQLGESFFVVRETGEGVCPTVDTRVRLHQMFADGSSTETKGSPVVRPVCWHDALLEAHLLQMRPGERRWIWIPKQGSFQRNNLVLLEVLPPSRPIPSPEVLDPPLLEPGVAAQAILEKGSGSKAVAGDQVTIIYHYFSERGRLIDSSFLDPVGSTLTLRDSHPAEGLAVSAKTRTWFHPTDGRARVGAGRYRESDGAVLQLLELVSIDKFAPGSVLWIEQAVAEALGRSLEVEETERLRGEIPLQAGETKDEPRAKVAEQFELALDWLKPKLRVIGTWSAGGPSSTTVQSDT